MTNDDTLDQLIPVLHIISTSYYVSQLSACPVGSRHSIVVVETNNAMSGQLYYIQMRQDCHNNCHIHR